MTEVFCNKNVNIIKKFNHFDKLCIVAGIPYNPIICHAEDIVSNIFAIFSKLRESMNASNCEIRLNNIVNDLLCLMRNHVGK